MSLLRFDLTTYLTTPQLQVWRSVRDWDEHSRTILSDYLRRARGVVQDCQAQVGVPVHVRLAGGSNEEDGSNKEDDGSSTLQRDVASSYAVWAITLSHDTHKVVRVACSEMAQTEVPRSGVQVVQVKTKRSRDPPSFPPHLIFDTIDSIFGAKPPPLRQGLIPPACWAPRYSQKCTTRTDSAQYLETFVS